jgi:hypothetical protein
VDLVLTPKQRGGELNYFIYPYAEVDGKEFDGVQYEVRYRDLKRERRTRRFWNVGHKRALAASHLAAPLNEFLSGATRTFLAGRMESTNWGALSLRLLIEGECDAALLRVLHLSRDRRGLSRSNRNLAGPVLISGQFHLDSVHLGFEL